MKALLKALLSAGLIIVCSPAIAQPAQPAAAALDKVINQAVADRTFVGAAVGVAENGKVVLARGYGLADLEDRAPVTDKTVFRIGSITKQFTAALILRLADQGKLSISDPLSKYFPDFPRAKEVTLQQLLSHTSGISTYTNPKSAEEYVALARTEWTSDSLIAHIAAEKPGYDFDPGTGWAYSNSGYILLGAIIEKVSGKSYKDFLTTEILTPLGLKDTTMDDYAEIVPNRAHGYAKSATSPSGFANPDFLTLSGAGPAGAMRSTVSDMLAWHTALFGGKVLKPQSLAVMTTPTRLKDGRLSSAGRAKPDWAPAGTEYGLGLFIHDMDGLKSIGHGGAIPGFNAWLETYPDKHTTIVLLSNGDFPAAEGTGPKVAKAYFDARKP
jgi:D-alanyl-D-alanine carboxypeptidase